MLFKLKTILFSSNLPHFLGTNILMLVYKWLNILPTILSTAKNYFFLCKTERQGNSKEEDEWAYSEMVSVTCYKNSQSLPLINQQQMHVMSLYYHWLCHYQNVELSLIFESCVLYGRELKLKRLRSKRTCIPSRICVFVTQPY